MSKFKLKKGIILQTNGEKITIFDGEKSLLYTFNGSASFIFKKIKKGQEKEKIVSDLIKKYKIDVQEAKHDLDEFIKDLTKRKIISIPKT